MAVLLPRSAPLRAVSAAAVLVAAGIGPAAHGELITYFATMNGANEVPPNLSPGTGSAQVHIDTIAHTMHIQANFTGLLAGTTAAHIHAATALPGVGTAGVATTTPTFPGFPLAVTSGVYDMMFDLQQLSSYNPAFVTAHGGTAAGAEAFLLASMAAGTSYFNIHSTMFPGGEIRGFLLVPSPGAAALLGLGGVLAMRRRRG